MAPIFGGLPKGMMRVSLGGSWGCQAFVGDVPSDLQLHGETSTVRIIANIYSSVSL
jgi:hypothetical protein